MDRKKAEHAMSENIDWAYLNRTAAAAKLKREIAEEYAAFLPSTDFPWCWFCGRDALQRPEGWYGKFLTERAHIVNKPRLENRRSVILLCSLCHKVQHGEQLALPGLAKLIVPTLSSILWLKQRFDPKFYDREFLQRSSITKLPTARKPPREVIENYYSRRNTPARK